MAAQRGGLITDPDNLSYEIANVAATTDKELVIDTTNFKLKLTQVGNLTRDGTTLKCLYSRLKDAWNTDPNLIIYPFPIAPITDEQYDLVDGWNFDKTINPTTKIVIANVTGTNGNTIITTTGSFTANFIAAGYFVSGSANLTANARVATVNSATSITLTTPLLGNISGSLTFNSGSDYTYNLIRTAGWAVKDASNVSSEEWMGVITLGALGEEGLLKTLTITANSSNSTNLTVNSTEGVIAGSFVAIPGALTGTRVSTVYSANVFSITRPVSATVGTRLTVRPKDFIYYQLGNSVDVDPTYAVLHGAINQPLQIYGNATSGNFDYRNPAVAKFYVREQGYTYDSATIADIGISTLTYQTYRFSITNASDALYITHTDSEISANGVVPTEPPYNNMSITWYNTPQPRQIGGSTYYFNVIIDANVQIANIGPTSFGTASAEQIYEYVQWALRRPVGVDIDNDGGVRTGLITRELVKFVGSTLYTIYDASDGGVYIDHFAAEDINRIVFSDNTNRQFPYISFGRLTFSDPYVNDGANTIYRLFYKQINQGEGSLKYGEPYASIVKSYSADPSYDGSNEIKGNLAGNLTFISFDYDWEENEECKWQANIAYTVGDEYRYTSNISTTWYRVSNAYTSGSSWSSNVDGIRATEIEGPSVVLAAVGLSQAQYAYNDGVIAQSATNTIDLQGAQENNYGT